MAPYFHRRKTGFFLRTKFPVIRTETDFSQNSPYSMYGQEMFRVLCITKERDWFQRVPGVFPELDLKLSIAEDFESLRDTQRANAPDVMVVDLDCFDIEQGRLPALENSITDPNAIILLLPARLSSMTASLKEQGYLVLTKPLSTGELGIALSRAKRNRNKQ